LRTEFEDRVKGTTSAWKKGNCDVDALGDIGSLSGISIARSNLGVNDEEWTRECTGDTCDTIIRVGGRVFNPKIDKRFTKPVSKMGYPYTKRIYSK